MTRLGSRPGTPEFGSGAPNLNVPRGRAQTTKKMLGAPLDLGPEQLDQAAEPTPVDVAAARALWQQHAPPKLVDLLDARRPDA